MALLPTACSSSRPTSSAEVETVLAECGIGESELLWVIDDKGSFLFGRPSDAAPPLTQDKRNCLMKWVNTERVRIGPVGVGAVR